MSCCCGTVVCFVNCLSPSERAELQTANYGASPNEGPGLPSTGSTPVAGVPCIGSPTTPSTGITDSTSSNLAVEKFWDAELPYIKGLFGLEGSATFSDFYNGTKSNVEAYYGWTLLEVALIAFVVLVLAIMLVHYING